MHDLRGTGPHDTYALRPPPGGWLPPEPYKPVQPRRSRSENLGSEVSRGVGLGFGWLAGAALAVLCCVVAIVVLQRSAGPVADWFNRQQAQWERSAEVARQQEASGTGQRDGEAEDQAGQTRSPAAGHAGNITQSGPKNEPDEDSSPVRVQAGDAPEDRRQRSFFADDDDEASDERPGAAEKSKPRQDGFRVVASRFYFATLDRRPEPIIEIRVQNGLDRTIGKISFCATLISRDRDTPLAEDFFGYEVDEGGLKPGEEAEWHLQPDSDSLWGRAPRDLTKLTLKIVTIGVEDGSGREILGWRGGNQAGASDSGSFTRVQTKPMKEVNLRETPH